MLRAVQVMLSGPGAQTARRKARFAAAPAALVLVVLGATGCRFDDDAVADASCGPCRCLAPVVLHAADVGRGVVDLRLTMSQRFEGWYLVPVYHAGWIDAGPLAAGAPVALGMARLDGWNEGLELADPLDLPASDLVRIAAGLDGIVALARLDATGDATLVAYEWESLDVPTETAPGVLLPPGRRASDLDWAWGGYVVTWVAVVDGTVNAVFLDSNFTPMTEPLAVAPADGTSSIRVRHSDYGYALATGGVGRPLRFHCFDEGGAGCDPAIDLAAGPVTEVSDLAFFGSFADWYLVGGSTGAAADAPPERLAVSLVHDGAVQWTTTWTPRGTFASGTGPALASRHTYGPYLVFWAERVEGQTRLWARELDLATGAMVGEPFEPFPGTVLTGQPEVRYYALERNAADGITTYEYAVAFVHGTAPGVAAEVGWGAEARLGRIRCDVHQ